MLMWNVNTLKPLGTCFIQTVTFAVVFNGCGNKDAKTSVPEPPIVQAHPLQTESPRPQNPPSPFQCVGEIFKSSLESESVSEFTQDLDLANWLYDGKTMELGSDQGDCTAQQNCRNSIELVSTLTKNENLGSLSLRTHKQNASQLFSVQQKPFHGFLQAGIRQTERGGWTLCEGAPEIWNELQARPIKCFVLWTDSNSESQHASFSIPKPSGQWETVFATSRFQLLYQATEHLILYKINDPKREVEIASAMTDRYFQSSRAVFDFNPFLISIDCKSEGF